MTTHHHFNIEDAMKYGVDAAIILNNFRYWLNFNKKKQRNHHDGCYWVYYSARALSELLPYFSENKIQKLIRKLELGGVLKAGNYNRKKYDRTKWYTLSDYMEDKSVESIQLNGEMDMDSSLNGYGENDAPIPNINTDKTSPSKKTSDFDLFLDNRCSTYELGDEFSHCKRAISVLRKLFLRGHYSFMGPLRFSEWRFCEQQMTAAEKYGKFNHFEYFRWWMENKASAFGKIPSLPNMLTDFKESRFSDFYAREFIQAREAVKSVPFS